MNAKGVTTEGSGGSRSSTASRRKGRSWEEQLRRQLYAEELKKREEKRRAITESLDEAIQLEKEVCAKSLETASMYHEEARLK